MKRFIPRHFRCMLHTRSAHQCSQTLNITLTLFSHLPCRLSLPQRFPPHSQMTPTRPYSSSTTSISYKLRSAPCDPWHTKRSTPCAFSLSLESLPSADERSVRLVKVPTSLDRAPHMQLVAPVSSPSYCESLFICDPFREPCCAEAMS